MYMNNEMVKIGTTAKVILSDTSIVIGSSFYGRINDMRIYDRILTVDEIDHLYRLPSSCAITTDLVQDAVPTSVPLLLQAVDLQGRTISQLDGYIGLAILLYSDGSCKKITKNNNLE